jgi:SET domain-containing protein
MRYAKRLLSILKTSKKKNLPHNNVFARICKSDIHGVGVFAIVDIPKGSYIFEGDKSEVIWFTEKDIELSSLPQPVQKLYKDFCIILPDGNSKKYGCPDSFNNMPISWYLNESKDPNVACDEDYDFYAIRDIKAEEELTVDYSTYSNSVTK